MLKEKELLLLIARVQLTGPEVARVKELFSSGLNWERLLFWAAKHKIYGLLWYHIMKYDLFEFVDPDIGKLLRLSYGGNVEKNKLYLQEFETILRACNAVGIKVIALKGALFLGDLYPDLGMRSVYDLDLLILPKHKKEFNQVLFELEYEQCKYDAVSDKFLYPSRKEKLTWDLYYHNLYPLNKKCAHAYVGSYEIGGHTSITWGQSKENYHIDTEELFNRAKVIDRYATPFLSLSAEDNVLHLCNHLYQHAASIERLDDRKDLYIMFFCDIREYVLSQKESLSWQLICDRVNQYELHRPVYYALYFLNELYAGTIDEGVLEAIRPDSLEYLDCFGMLESDKPMKWKLPFKERLFDVGRYDEFKAAKAFL